MNKLSKIRLQKLYEMSSGVSTSKNSAGHGFPFISFSTIFNNFYLPDILEDLMEKQISKEPNLQLKKEMYL